MNSKYLGMKFGKWTVVKCEYIDKNHLRYYLTKKTSTGLLKTITLRDHSMAKLSRGETNADILEQGKLFQQEQFKNNGINNWISYTWPTDR